MYADTTKYEPNQLDKVDEGSYRQEWGTYYGKLNVFCVTDEGERVHLSRKPSGQQFTSYVLQYTATHTAGTDAPVEGTISLREASSLDEVRKATSDFVRQTEDNESLKTELRSSNLLG